MSCLQAAADVDAACVAPFCPTDPPPSAARLRRIRRTLWRLRRALDAVGTPEAQRALRDLFSFASRDPARTRRTIVAWVDFLENLAQEAERAYGRQPGQGNRKAQLVKGAVLRILQREQVLVDDIPAFVQPFLFDAVVGMLVDLVCRVLNSHPEMWQASNATGPRRVRIRSAAVGAATGLARRMASALTRLTWWLVLRQHDLGPRLEAAVDALTSQHDDLLRASARDILWLLDWLTRNGKVLAALVEPVLLAVREAESFLAMSGPEKAAYARDLVVELLVDEKVIAPGGLGSEIASSVVDLAIDPIVHLLNKRAVFHHRGRKRAAAGKTP